MAFTEQILLATGIGYDDVGGFGNAFPVRIASLVGEGLKIYTRDGEVPTQVVDHLPLHQIDITELIKALANDCPTLVRVSVIAHNF